MDTIFYYFSNNESLGSSTKEKLVNVPNLQIGSYETTVFVDSETKIVSTDDVRGKKIIILCSTSSPVNESVMRLLIFIDGVKRGGASEIVLIAPYLGYSRQDRQIQPNDPVTLQMIVNMYKQTGVDRIYRFDPHSEYDEGYFTLPVISVSSEVFFAEYFEILFKIFSIDPKDVVVLSPDHGALNRGLSLHRNIEHSSFASISKKRLGDESVRIVSFEGDVHDKVVIIYDDIASSGETAFQAINTARQKGASKVFVAVAHAVFSTRVEEIFHHLRLNGLIVTNSIESALSSGTDVIDIAPLVARIVLSEMDK